MNHPSYSCTSHKRYYDSPFWIPLGHICLQTISLILDLLGSLIPCCKQTCKWYLSLCPSPYQLGRNIKSPNVKFSFYWIFFCSFLIVLHLCCLVQLYCRLLIFLIFGFLVQILLVLWRNFAPPPQITYHHMYLV